MRDKYNWVLPHVAIALGEQTAVMGILNVTPDSFSDAGQYFNHDKAIGRGQEIEQAGGDTIDVGGESIWPGNERVPEAEVNRRDNPVIQALAAAVKIRVWIDTWRSA